MSEQQDVTLGIALILGILLVVSCAGLVILWRAWRDEQATANKDSSEHLEGRKKLAAAEQTAREQGLRLAEFEEDAAENHEAIGTLERITRIQADNLRDLREQAPLLTRRAEEAECWAEKWLADRNRLMLEREKIEGEWEEEKANLTRAASERFAQMERRADEAKQLRIERDRFKGPLEQLIAAAQSAQEHIDAIHQRECEAMRQERASGCYPDVQPVEGVARLATAFVRDRHPHAENLDNVNEFLNPSKES